MIRSNTGGNSSVPAGDVDPLVKAIVEHIEALECRLWTPKQLVEWLDSDDAKFEGLGRKASAIQQLVSVKKELQRAGVTMRKSKVRVGVYYGFERRKRAKRGGK